MVKTVLTKRVFVFKIFNKTKGKQKRQRALKLSLQLIHPNNRISSEILILKVNSFSLQFYSNKRIEISVFSNSSNLNSYHFNLGNSKLRTQTQSKAILHYITVV